MLHWLNHVWTAMEGNFYWWAVYGIVAFVLKKGSVSESGKKWSKLVPFAWQSGVKLALNSIIRPVSSPFTSVFKKLKSVPRRTVLNQATYTGLKKVLAGIERMHFRRNDTRLASVYLTTNYDALFEMAFSKKPEFIQSIA